MIYKGKYFLCSLNHASIRFNNNIYSNCNRKVGMANKIKNTYIQIIIGLH